MWIVVSARLLLGLFEHRAGVPTQQSMPVVSSVFLLLAISAIQKSLGIGRPLIPSLFCPLSVFFYVYSILRSEPEQNLLIAPRDLVIICVCVRCVPSAPELSVFILRLRPRPSLEASRSILVYMYKDLLFSVFATRSSLFFGCVNHKAHCYWRLLFVEQHNIRMQNETNKNLLNYFPAFSCFPRITGSSNQCAGRPCENFQLTGTRSCTERMEKKRNHEKGGEGINNCHRSCSSSIQRPTAIVKECCSSVFCFDLGETEIILERARVVVSL